MTALFWLLLFMIRCNTGMQLFSFPSEQYQGKTLIAAQLQLTNFVEMNNHYILLNAKHLFSLKQHFIQRMDSSYIILIDNITLNNRYSIAIYGEINNNFKLFDVDNIDVNKTSVQIGQKTPIFKIISQYTQNTMIYGTDSIELSVPGVSVYYSVWHTLVAHSFNNISYNMQQMNIENKISNNKAPNVDNVLGSNDTISLNDIINSWSWTINASITNSSIKPVYPTSLMFWHQQPHPLSYYCIYNDPQNSFGVHNCSNITQILTEHAYMLSSSGIDFIILDLTNHWLGPDDYYSWIWQIRPTQVLYETWDSFRESGTITPKIAVWNPTNGTQYMQYLDLYNKYPKMCYKAQLINSTESRYLYFSNPRSIPGQSCEADINSCYNETVINMIESNNDKNNIIIIKAFVTSNINKYNQGFWTYMTPCRVNTNQDYFYWTTSLETLNICNQLITRNSPIGTQMSAAFQYIPWSNPWSSLPFASPTKLNGRTIQLQIADVIAKKPDYIMFPSFNEQHCGPSQIEQTDGGNNTWSVGLYKDKMRNTKYMDSYTSERSRVIEPSLESGDYYFRLFQSCIRILRISYYFKDIINYHHNDQRICNVEGEICCSSMTQFYDVWSMKNVKNGDFMVSNNYTEVKEIINNESYQEICVPSVLSNSSVFCHDTNDLYTFDQHRGPFVLLMNGTNPEPKDGSNAYVQIERIPIYRCIDNNNGFHFIANDVNCNDVVTNYKNEILLGYGMKTVSSAMSRQLIRCKNTKMNYYYHVLDDHCFSNDLSSPILSYVL